MLSCRDAACFLPCVRERDQAAAAPVSCPALLAPGCSLLVLGMRKPELREPALPPDTVLLLGQSGSLEPRSLSAWLSKSVGRGGAVQWEGAGGGAVWRGPAKVVAREGKRESQII